jgi:hypothetical protein
MTKHRDPGLDGLDALEAFLLAQEAARAHPTRVRLPDVEEVIHNLELFKRKVLAGGCGGQREGAP